jgi:predicted Mrr-cat superfamily restriction endonuclease
MDIDLVIRALRSHIDNQRMIADHYDYTDMEELHLDEEIIRVKIEADRDIHNSQSLIKELIKLNQDKNDYKNPNLFSCTSLPFLEVIQNCQECD